MQPLTIEQQAELICLLADLTAHIELVFGCDWDYTVTEIENWSSNNHPSFMERFYGCPNKGTNWANGSSLCHSYQDALAFLTKIGLIYPSFSVEDLERLRDRINQM